MYHCPATILYMKPAAIWLCVSLTLSASENPPELAARDVVRAADRAPGGVAPGEILLVFPSNAGPEVLAEGQRDSQGKMTTLLAETRVWFEDVAAPLVYAVKGQVSVIVPYEISGRKTTQVSVEYRGVRSTPVTLSVLEAAPALFTLDASGRGQAAMLNETGCCNSAQNPAARGTFAALYATGEGQTNPPGITGLISTHPGIADYPVPRGKVRVTVGGEPAEIGYAAEAPHTVAGLLQVNFRVPQNAPIGDAVPIVLMVGNYRSPDGLTMAVRSDVQQILLMDLHPQTRIRLRSVLAKSGYRVFVARDFSEGLAKAHENPIDLIITSLAMPELDRIKKERPRVRIIAMGAGLDTETLRSADLLGAQAVLTETMGSQEILQRVRELLRRRAVQYVAAPEIPPRPRR